MEKRHYVTASLVALFLITLPLIASARPRAELTSSTGDQTLAQATSPAPTPAQMSEATKNLETIQYSFRQVASSVVPVVVEIDVTETVTQPQARGNTPQSPFDWFFNMPPNGNGQSQPRQFSQEGLGSGIVVRHTGDTYYVLTNNHVVGDATKITIRLNDQRSFPGTLKGTDQRKDLALVSFTSKDNLPIAELGDSDSLQVGDIVLAVGNPFGYASTITMGIVSALGRTVTQSSGLAQNTDYIQTDAAINQGNSGGALVNIRGQVVGINTWIAAPTGGNVGLGFAIPINNAAKTIDDLLTTGKTAYGWLGVQITDVVSEPLYADLVKDLRLSNVAGAFVINVFRGSPADKAGFLPGDYVTKMDTQNIKDANQLTQIVGGLLAGRSYDFEIIRYGEKQKLSVKIGARDDKDTVAQSKNLWPGMTVVDVTDDVRQQFEQNNVTLPANVGGVVIAYLADDTTPAAVAGLRIGDIITEINGKPVKNTMDFFKAVNDKTRKDITFRLNRQDTELTIGLTR